MIRIMTMDDYEEVYKLWKKIHGFGIRSIDDSREGIERFIKRNPATSSVAEMDGKIVGSILCGHDGRRGYIYHTAVLPSYRNQGIAGRLVDAAMGALEEEGIHKVALVVFKKNDIGNGFWEHIGFTDRDDLIYRNKNIYVLDKIET